MEVKEDRIQPTVCLYLLLKESPHILIYNVEPNISWFKNVHFDVGLARPRISAIDGGLDIPHR